MPLRGPPAPLDGLCALRPSPTLRAIAGIYVLIHVRPDTYKWSDWGRSMVDEHRSMTFACAETAPAEARRWGESVLDSWQVRDHSDDVLLLVSELVNNAVRHCHSDVEVAVTQLNSAIHVEVFDDGAGQLPVLKAVGSSDLHGRGLHMVDAVAGHWGYREIPPRKAVWFDISV